MVTPSTMHIVCGVDSAYARHCAVVLRSLRECHPHHRLHVTLLHAGLDRDEALKLYSDGAPRVDALSLVQVSADLLQAFPVDGHITPAAYLRLVLGEVMPLSVQRVLYLDCDILVRQPLDALWALDLDGHVLGAVAAPNDPENCQRLQLDNGRGYFNSGVLLIDLDRYRRFGVYHKAIHFVQCHPERIRWHDQDVLNYLLRDHWLSIADCWNVTTPWWLISGDTLRPDVDLRDPDRHLSFVPALIHFTGGGWYKPWNYLCLHPHRQAYRHLASQTPWRHLPLLERPGVWQSWRRGLRLRSRLKTWLAHASALSCSPWAVQ